MKIFVNKISGIKWFTHDQYVVEGADSYYIKGANVSLPKSEWEEKEDERLDGR